MFFPRAAGDGDILTTLPLSRDPSTTSEDQAAAAEASRLAAKRKTRPKKRVSWPPVCSAPEVEVGKWGRGQASAPLDPHWEVPAAVAVGGDDVN